MKAADPIDAARLSLAFPISACPRSSSSGLTLPHDPTRRAGRPHAFWPRSPSARWPNGPVAGSSVISTKPACHPADVRQFRVRCGAHDQRERRSSALAAGDSWLEKGANLLMFGPPAPADRILGPRSAWRWWRAVRACCSRAPPTWSSGSRPPAATSSSRQPSPGSTSITSSSSMTSPTSARTRRRPAFCSSSSRPAANAAPC